MARNLLIWKGNYVFFFKKDHCFLEEKTYKCKWNNMQPADYYTIWKEVQLELRQHVGGRTKRRVSSVVA